MVENDWRHTVALPADNPALQGRIRFCDLLPKLALFIIDIHTHVIPDIYPSAVFNPSNDAQYMTINYCHTGRCELELKNGSCTYLGGGEVAIEAGQAKRGNSTFYYPTSHYHGCELVLMPDVTIGFDGNGGADNVAARLWNRCACLKDPAIISAGDTFTAAFAQLSDDALNQPRKELATLDVFRILHLLEEIPQDDNRRRDYFTPSQTQIAKEAMRLITDDTSRRRSAAELAAHFGISESSLKNYFKGVYGYGFAQFQREMRMQKAAELLRETKQPVGVVSGQVGFASQSKFGRAFKDFFGVTPTEYRRQSRIANR